MLKKEELLKIQGGGIASVLSCIGICIGAAVTFVMGLFDGYVNPVKCNNK